MSGGTDPVRVRVRLFAMQRELVGAREVELSLSRPASVADAWAALVDRVPAIGPGTAFVRFAVNGAWAGPETPLGDRDELAVIPPVSGGAGATGGGAGATGGGAESAGGGPPATRILELRGQPLGPDILEHLAARLAVPADGAVVAFLGLTRETPGTPAPGQAAEAAIHAGRRVEHLDYEAFEPLALAVLGAIADETGERFGVERLAIVHRIGVVPLGQASIAIVAAAPHRAAAFDAVRYAIEETKARAPIWKAEHFAGGHVWIGRPVREGPR
jgi:molybdopterin synthase catalytic subunit